MAAQLLGVCPSRLPLLRLSGAACALAHGLATPSSCGSQAASHAGSQALADALGCELQRCAPFAAVQTGSCRLQGLHDARMSLSIGVGMHACVSQAMPHALACCASGSGCAAGLFWSWRFRPGTAGLALASTCGGFPAQCCVYEGHHAAGSLRKTRLARLWLSL